MGISRVQFCFTMILCYNNPFHTPHITRQSIISNIEADVMELEENKVNSETKKILFDIEDTTTTEFSSALLGLDGEGGGGGGSGDEAVRRSREGGKEGGAGKRGELMRCVLDVCFLSPNMQFPFSKRLICGALTHM